MAVFEECFFYLIGIAQPISRIPVEDVLGIKCRFHEIANARDVLSKKRPSLVLPGSIFIHETFQKIRLLNEIGIKLSGDLVILVGQFAEGVESLEKGNTAFLN